MNWIAILTSVCLSLLFIGFAIGFLRSWKKSLIRFGILVGALLLAIFLSPVISSKLMKIFVKGTSFVGFGMNLNFEDVASGLVGDEQFVADLLTTTSTTTELATALLNVVMNLAGFLLVFFVVAFISLLVYWLVVLILHIQKKKDIKENGETPIEKDASYWWLKVLGGGIGLVSMFIICFVVLTPVFGAMNVCDKFLTTSSASASAAAPNSFICGELYYKENKQIGGIEGYIETYADLRADYNKSFIGKTFNFFGVSKLGTATFNRLTNVSTGGLKLNVTNELVAVIKTYNIYKEHFIKNQFDITNNESIDGILKIYDVANESEIVSSYIEEFVPNFCDRWLKGEKFLGIEMPIKGDLEPLAKEILEVFNSANETRIESNIKAIAGVVKVANNNGLIEAVQQGTNLIEFLGSNQTFVKDAVLQLSTTNELRHAMPGIMCDFTELIYKVVIAGDATFEEANLTNEEIDRIVWATEAERLQGLSNSVLEVFDALGSGSESAFAEQLVNIGKIIDNAKNSKLVSKPFKVFIDDFVSSEAFKLDATIKETITTSIDEHWDDESYSFEAMFKTLQETIKVTQSIVTGSGSVDLNDLSGVLGEVIENESVKETIKETLSSDIVSKVLGEDTTGTVEVLTDMLGSFIDGTSKETIDQDIAAGQEIINIVDSVVNNQNELVLEGTTTEEKQAKADEILETIAGSDVVMDMLADENNTAVKDIAQSLTGEDANLLIGSIETNENLTAEQKQVLANLFGIVLP